jgi:hypothetical protein
MPASCFAGITFQGAVLDRVLWHSQPFSIHQHLNPVGRSSVLGWTAVTLIAATLSKAIF